MQLLLNDIPLVLLCSLLILPSWINLRKNQSFPFLFLNKIDVLFNQICHWTYASKCFFTVSQYPFLRTKWKVWKIIPNNNWIVQFWCQTHVQRPQKYRKWYHFNTPTYFRNSRFWAKAAGYLNKMNHHDIRIAQFSHF